MDDLQRTDPTKAAAAQQDIGPWGPRSPNEGTIEPNKERTSARSQEPDLGPWGPRRTEQPEPINSPPEPPTSPMRPVEHSPEPAEAPSREQGSDKEDGSKSISVTAGDLPPALRAKYFCEKKGGMVGLHTDAKDAIPAIKDSGDKLATDRPSPSVVRDMIATAEHRGWDSIHVKGDADFRREVWLNGMAKGIEVTGYKPTERDLQELEKIKAGRENAIERNERQSERQPDHKPDARPDFNAGVKGILREIGSAPYGNEPQNEPSPYIKLELPSGEVKQIWGVGLPDAIQRGGAEVGDSITVRRDGIEKVEKEVRVKDESGQFKTERQVVDRNKWEVVAEKFRTNSEAERARDPETRNAQATLKAVETMLLGVSDKGLRERLIEAAKEHVATKLEGGAKFKEVRLREERRKDPTPENGRKLQRQRTNVATRINRLEAAKTGNVAREKTNDATRQIAKDKKAEEGKQKPDRQRSR